MHRWLVVLLLPLACSDGSETDLIGDPLPSGILTVGWRIVDADGEALSCRSAGVGAVEIAIGGEPTRTPCADEVGGQVRFDELAQGVYPVVIRLIAMTGAVRDEHANQVAVDAPTASYTHDFVVDAGSNDGGAIELTWNLGDSPATGCATFGVARVQVQSQPGSIAGVTAELPCAEGLWRADQLRRGTYTLRLTLLDPADTPIAAGVVQRTYSVEPGNTTRDDVRFTPAPPAILRLEWTIDETPAVDRCSVVGGQEVAASLLSRPLDGTTTEIATMTASCAAGQLTLENVATPAQTDSPGFRLSARLRGFAGVVLTSTAVDDIVLMSGRTSTVGFDLRVQP